MQHHHTASAAAILALAAALTLGHAPAGAAPACPNGARPTPKGACIAKPDRRTTCAWPAIIDGERVTVCVRR